MHTGVLGYCGLVHFHPYHCLGLRLQPHLTILLPRVEERRRLLLCLGFRDIISAAIVAHLYARFLAYDKFTGAGLNLFGLPGRFLGALVRMDGQRRCFWLGNPCRFGGCLFRVGGGHAQIVIELCFLAADDWRLRLWLNSIQCRSISHGGLSSSFQALLQKVVEILLLLGLPLD